MHDATEPVPTNIVLHHRNPTTLTRVMNVVYVLGHYNKVQNTRGWVIYLTCFIILTRGCVNNIMCLVHTAVICMYKKACACVRVCVLCVLCVDGHVVV